MLRTDETKVRAAREGSRCQVHHLDVRNVAVGKNDLVDLFISYQALQIFLAVNRNAVRIARAAQAVRIAARFDARDLGGREGDDFISGIVAEKYVEGVKISSRCAQDQHPVRRHDRLTRGLRLR